VATTERGQREESKPDTDGSCQEASMHAQVTLTRALQKHEECQQSQTGRQLKPKPKPKPHPTPTLTPRTTCTLVAVTTSVPTPVRRWETVPSRNQKKLASPAPALTTGSRLVECHLILRRERNLPLPNKMD
jgi:hypothetical protein